MSHAEGLKSMDYTHRNVSHGNKPRHAGGLALLNFVLTIHFAINMTIM